VEDSKVSRHSEEGNSKVGHHLHHHHRTRRKNQPLYSL
jgi:hypothetical protein